MSITTSTTPALTWLSPAGRTLIALLFVPAGFAKTMAPAATAGFMASGGLPDWPALAVLVGLFEIAAGIALALGLGVRWAALALAAFTLFASLLFHAYWAAPPEQQMVQQLLFFKNLAAIGGLLFIAALGAGPWSIDALRRPTEENVRQARQHA
jgi:putative oxidoreductase